MGGNGKGHGHGRAFGKGGPQAPGREGHGRGQDADELPDGMNQPMDDDTGIGDSADSGSMPSVHGRSSESPGHLNQAAGARSARDFAPGRARRS